MSWYRKTQVMISKETIVLFSAVCGAALLGLAGLWLVEQELVARAGESLALAATGVADKLDAMLRERDGDLEIIASAPQVRSTDSAQVTRHLRAVQVAYPVYSRLAVANRAGRIVASTDEDWIGRDVHRESWYQAAWQAPRVQVKVIREPGEAAGQLTAVVFSMPISDANGTLLGVVMTEVDRTTWTSLIEESVNQFSARTESFGIVRYRALGHDGGLLLTAEQHDQSSFNLRDMGLPSAIKVATGRAGYVEEIHLIKKIPVVTGYARMTGVRSLASLQWGLLVQAERTEVLASIRARLVKMGLLGLVGFMVMLAALVWTNHRHQREQVRVAGVERARADGEERLRAIVDHAADGIVTIDDQGRILSFNPAAETLFGYTAGDVIGRNVNMLMPEPYASEHDGYVASYLCTGQAKIIGIGREVAGRRRNGSVFPMDLAVSEMRLESGRCFTGIVRDVTARKQMIERLNERETFFRLLSEHLPIGVFEIDEAGQCLYENKTLTTLLRQHTDEKFGLADATDLAKVWLEWFHEDDRQTMQEAWDSSRETFGQVRQECRLAMDGAEPQWVQILLWPLASDTGFRYLGTVEDITARKQTIAHTMQLLRHGHFELHTLTEARNLAELLAYAFPDPSRTQVGLTELFVNGVEHGNLGLSYEEKTALLEAGTLDREIARRLALPEYARKRVWVSMDRTETQLRVSVADEGAGFDWAQYLSADATRPGEGHGRGIAMAKAISFDKLEYQGRGNQVVVTTELAHSDPKAGEETQSEAA
ncbi:MAG: PAS domain S-box protein [Nitrospira sp.]|nr:MAG: PAS domain S-box protein [Nitrospira sp.]